MYLCISVYYAYDPLTIKPIIILSELKQIAL